VMGFAAGVAADLFLPTPFGLSALVGCLMGYTVGAMTFSVDKSVWWFPPLIALGASAAATMSYALLGATLGDNQFLYVNLPAIILTVGIANALCASRSVKIMRWVFVDAATRRSPISIHSVA
jgi:rod shape-determining protein MreD